MKTKDIIKNGRLAELRLNSDIWRNRGVEIFKIAEFQYRFIKEGREIDYFPISGKYHDVKQNIWGTIPAYSLYELFENPAKVQINSTKGLYF